MLAFLNLDGVIKVNPKSMAYGSTLIEVGAEEEEDGLLPFEEEETIAFLFLSLIFLSRRKRRGI